MDPEIVRFTRAWRKAQRTPLDLDESDFRALAIYPDEIARVHEWQRAAQVKAAHPCESVPTPRAPENGTPTPAIARAAVLPVIGDAAAFDTPESLDAWAQENLLCATPVFLWAAFVRGGRENRLALERRVESVERRLAAFEAKPHVKFCGVYEPGRTYAPGDAATHHGSLWICKVATPGEPSKDFVGWQLAVKKGSAADAH